VTPIGMVVVAAALGSASARAQAAPVVEIVPSLVQLSSAPARVELMVRGAPETAGFKIELVYDADSIVVTALESGGFLESNGATAAVVVRQAGPGRLTIAGDIADAAGAADRGEGVRDASAPTDAGGAADAPLASGGGRLAVVTFAPLARSEGSRPLTIAGATLRDRAGAPVDADGVDAQVSVSEDPPAELRDEALAQARALAEQAASTGGLAGIAATIDRAFSDLTRRIGGAGVGLGPQAVWLAVLAIGLAVVGLGWYFGRRPPAPTGGAADPGGGFGQPGGDLTV